MMMTKSAIFGLVLTSLSVTRPVMAQGAPAATVPYCPDLQRVIELAMSKERFARSRGPRQGNFTDTKLALTGGRTARSTAPTPTPAIPRSTPPCRRARTSRVAATDEDLPGEGWSEATDRSSAAYVVLHHALRPVSITEHGQTDDKKHLSI
jgi:hypothetical protein